MLRDNTLIPLSHQHHNGLALCVLTERSLAADSSPANIAQLARRAVDRYDIELTNHFALEEEILFPALEALQPLVSSLIADHRRMTALCEQLRGEPSEAVLREFTELLRAHIRREENELFEQAQRILPREQLDEIGRRIEERVVRVCL